MNRDKEEEIDGIRYNRKMLPFKTKLLSPLVVNVAKQYLNVCFLLKEAESKGHHFDFDRNVKTITKALATLIFAREIKADQAEAILKFLSYKQRQRSYT